MGYGLRESRRKPVYKSVWKGAAAWGEQEAKRHEEVSFSVIPILVIVRLGKTLTTTCRYVIDEVVGSVDVLCQFDSLGTMPDSHEIRVIDGKVKYVHTITALKIG